MLFRQSELLPEGRDRSRIGLSLAGTWLSWAGQGENPPHSALKATLGTAPPRTKKIPWKKCHSLFTLSLKLPVSYSSSQ